MSASKVSATVFPSARGPFLKTGVRPAGPGASVGGRDTAAVGALGAGRLAWGAEGAPQAVSAAPSAQAAATRRTRMVTERT